MDAQRQALEQAAEAQGLTIGGWFEDAVIGASNWLAARTAGCLWYCAERAGGLIVAD